MSNRESLIEKILALMSKTVDNGCSEHEALAALDKARAMMDAYEVTESDLQLTKEESAVLRSEPAGTKDANGIKAGLAVAVAAFTDCRVWKGRQGGLVFCGMKSDAQFATWLLDNLTSFVQGELMRHLMGSVAGNADRRLVINGFVGGCTSRISGRLNALCAQSATVASTNGRALVVVKTAAISEKMKEHGVHLRGGGSSRRLYDPSAYAAGKAAGDRASFGRPVTGANAQARIGR